MRSCIVHIKSTELERLLYRSLMGGLLGGTVLTNAVSISPPGIASQAQGRAAFDFGTGIF